MHLGGREEGGREEEEGRKGRAGGGKKRDEEGKRRGDRAMNEGTKNSKHLYKILFTMYKSSF